MPEQSPLDAVVSLCRETLAEYGEGDYYLGRDSLARAVLEMLDKSPDGLP